MSTRKVIAIVAGFITVGGGFELFCCTIIISFNNCVLWIVFFTLFVVTAHAFVSSAHASAIYISISRLRVTRNKTNCVCTHDTYNVEIVTTAQVCAWLILINCREEYCDWRRSREKNGNISITHFISCSMYSAWLFYGLVIFGGAMSTRTFPHYTCLSIMYRPIKPGLASYFLVNKRELTLQCITCRLVGSQMNTFKVKANLWPTNFTRAQNVAI